MTTFRMKLTAIGATKIAAYMAGGDPVDLVEVAVGDGNGAPIPLPTGAETALVREVWRDSLLSLEISDSDDSVVLVEAVILSAAGGFTIREIGVFDVDGDLFAYGNFPATYKSVAAEGATREVVIRASIRVASTDAVTIVVDASFEFATRAWCDGRFLRIDANLSDVDDPDEARANIGAEPAIAPGTTNKFWRGDKTWQDFPSYVRASLLTGISFVSGAAITAADTVLDAFGKLQAQITALAATVAGLKTVPVGGMLPIAGDPGTGWLRCDGAAYLQSAHSGLFAKVGLLPRLSWTKRTDPGLTDIAGLAFANGNFVIFRNGETATSKYSANNGVTWSTWTPPASGGWRSICWTGTKYVIATEEDSHIANATSMGGTFTSRTSAFSGDPGNANVVGLASDGAGKVVALGYDDAEPAVMLSTNNGDAWALCTLPGLDPEWGPRDLIYADGRWVASFTDSVAAISYVYTSTNGTVWTQVAAGLPGDGRSLSYFAGAFYLASGDTFANFRVSKSDDGITWAVLPVPAYKRDFWSNIYSSGDGSAAQLPNGLFGFHASEINLAGYVCDDFRQVMELPPPPSGGYGTNSSSAWSGSLIMTVHNAGNHCHTTPFADYDTATEFIVPDVRAPSGANAAPFFIRAN